MGAIWAYIHANLIADVVSFSVYAVIAALFGVCVVKCVAPVLRSRRVLKRASRQMRRGDESKRKWEDEKLLGSGPLMAYWREYLDNARFAEGEYYNPSSVEDYLNEDTAIYGPGRAALGEAMPGLMVSMGFLGTLIGISMGLSGFDLTDSEALMAAVRQLVPGMQYAFYTSIVGVVASICSTVLIRAANGSALRALLDFYGVLGRSAGTRRVDPMTQVAIYQQDQARLLQTLVEDVMGPMSERMAASIEQSVAPLQKTLDEFMHFTTRDQMRAVDGMVQRFLQAMNGAIHDQFDELGRTIVETNRLSARTHEGMGDAVDGFRQMAEELRQIQAASAQMLTQFEHYTKQIGENYAMVEDNHARIASNAERLEIVARQQTHYLQSVGQMQEEATLAMQRFQASAEQFMAQFSGDALSAKASLGAVADELKAGAQMLSDGQKTLINGINKDIDRTYNEFFEQTNHTVERLMQSAMHMHAQIEGMPEYLRQTIEVYSEQTDKLVAALDDAVRQLSGR